MTTALASPIRSAFDSPRGALRIRRARSLDDVDALTDGWQALVGSIPSPLGQFIWTRAAAYAFDQDARPHVVVACRGERIAALAPLVSKKLYGVRRLFLAGANELFEPMDLVWADEAALVRVATSLARRGTPLLFQRMPANSPSVKALERAYRCRAIVMARPQATCPYIALDDTWLEPEAHLNAGRRSDLRRARRKAEQLGPVATEIHTPDLRQLPELLDTAFEIEARGWKGEAGTALAHDVHRAMFYRQYAEAACVEGVLRICLLRIGDRVAAMQLAVEQGSGFYLLKVGYDDRFASCSPGLLLMRDTIRYAVEAGLKSYEFLGRAEAWTRVWTTTEHANVSLRVYPLGVRGLSALAADVAVALYKRWRKT